MFLKVENVQKSFGNTPVLRGLTFNLSRGEQCAIQGASGSGKSTLLYLMGGLDRPSSGDIKVDEQSLLSMDDESLALFRNKSVGFVFQFHFLLPSMKCMDNILLPAKIGGVALKEVKQRVESFAERLGVTHCLSKYPYEISGGEQQRINIIRALSLKPKLLLCDEPTGNLDSKNSIKVNELLIELANSLNTTLVVVTHDERIASSFTRKITIEDGQIIG
jgi:lipoprotein-releasing system ATP-binding protein